MLSSDNRARNLAGARKGIRVMTGKRISIAQVMMLVALLALNLAIVRATPVEITSYPSIWVALGTLDFLIISKLIRRRSFRAFHYTFLIFFVIAYFVMAYQVSVDRLHPLGFLVRLVQENVGAQTIDVSMLGYFMIAEFWAVAFLALVGACAVRLVRRVAGTAPTLGHRGVLAWSARRFRNLRARADSARSRGLGIGHVGIALAPGNRQARNALGLLDCRRLVGFIEAEIERPQNRGAPGRQRGLKIDRQAMEV